MMNWSSQKFLWGIIPILLFILVSADDIKAQISSVGGFEGDFHIFNGDSESESPVF